MSKNGPILLIEDNYEEQYLYKYVLNKFKISNPLLFFRNGLEGLEYLETTNEKPFLIICDIQMPGMDGIAFRDRVNADQRLRKKAIPFVFRTGTPNHKDLSEAYELAIQGFFVKTDDLLKLERQMRIIIDYWRESLEPSNAF